MRKLILVVLALAVVFMSGCGGNRDPQVITLKDRTVRLSEIVSEYDRLKPDLPWASASPEERLKFIETVAQKEVLVKVVRDKYGDQLPAREAQLFERWLEGREVERYWAKINEAAEFSSARQDSMKKLTHVQRQFTNVTSHDEDLIRAIFARVRAGEDLVAVGRKFEADTKRVSVFEDIWADRAEMPVEYGDVLFSMNEQGEVSEPSSSMRYGWFIMRYEGERDRAPAMDQTTAEIAAQRFYDAVKTRKELEIDKKYGFRLAEENVSLVRERFAPYWDSLTGGNPQRFSVDLGLLRGPVHLFTPEERARPLIQWNGGAWTLNDYVNSLNTANLFYWPGQGDDATIRRRILRRMEQWALRQEAQASGVLAGDDFEVEKQRKRQELLLDAFFQENVQMYDYGLTREEVERYWEQHQDKYWSKDLATYGFIWFPSRFQELARQTSERLQRGARWEEVGAEMIRRDPSIKHEPMLGPTDTGVYPDVTAEALKLHMPPDGKPFVADPIQVANGDWLILKMFAREEPYQLDFAAAEEDVRIDLTGEKMDERIKQLIDQYSKELSLKIDTKAIQ